MLQQSLPNVELYHQPKTRGRTCKTWCTGVPFTSWFRSSKIHGEKRRIGYVVDLVIGGMIGAGVLREKLENQSASTTWKSLQSFFWMPFDHGIGLCFIDFSKWKKLISGESMNDKGHLFIFALHTKIAWFVRIYCQPPKNKRWLNLKGNAPKKKTFQASMYRAISRVIATKLGPEACCSCGRRG